MFVFCYALIPSELLLAKTIILQTYQKSKSSLSINFFLILFKKTIWNSGGNTLDKIQGNLRSDSVWLSFILYIWWPFRNCFLFNFSFLIYRKQKENGLLIWKDFNEKIINNMPRKSHVLSGTWLVQNERWHHHFHY